MSMSVQNSAPLSIRQFAQATNVTNVVKAEARKYSSASELRNELVRDYESLRADKSFLNVSINLFGLSPPNNLNFILKNSIII